MRVGALILLLLLVGACAARIDAFPTVGKPTRDPHCPDYSGVTPGYYGGDGSSEERAVETIGFEYSAYRWLEENHPGAQVISQALVISPETNLKYDLMTFERANGETKEAWFWVSGGVECFMK